MNTYASKNNFTLYKNPGAEKRNTYQAMSKRVYKNFETIKRSNRGNIDSDKKKYSGSSVDSIIELFRGTIVTDEIGLIEWKAHELFTLPFNH
jgi:hypothetical protein